MIQQLSPDQSPPECQRDGELLERYVAGREPAAFEEIVRRHGPTVLGVCRRVLGNEHDSEDAFQATFLVLIRKAADIMPRELVGNWLYGVAYRTALKARGAAAQRRTKERLAPRQEAQDAELWSDLASVLDAEMNRLPRNYRAVLVSCALEGKPNEEIARQLGLPAGTVSSRLARARALLAKRLARRGLAITTASLAAVLTAEAASPMLPASLLTAVLKTGLCQASDLATSSIISSKVACLAEGVMRMSIAPTLKMAAIGVVGVAVIGLALSSIVYVPVNPQPAANTSRASKNKGQGAVVENELIQGSWRIARDEYDGKHDTETAKIYTVEITKDRLIFHFQQRDGNGQAVPARKEWVYELYASTAPASPQGIDTTYAGMWTGDTFMDDPNPKTRRGIYTVEGDTLKLCQPVDASTNRPTEFEGKAGSGVRLLILERVK